MTETSGPSCPMSLSPYEKIEEPFLQMLKLQTEADPCCLVRNLLGYAMLRLGLAPMILLSQLMKPKKR